MEEGYVAVAATGEHIPYPLSKKSTIMEIEGQKVDVPEGMVYIPPGEFSMGEGVAPPEGPEHKVRLDGYCIGKYEVTNVEWKAFVDATGYQKKPWSWRDGVLPKGQENHPVAAIGRADALKYCEWVSRGTGRDVRLPTEAQWEKAARGPKHLKYPWGDEWDKGACNWLGTWAPAAGLPMDAEGFGKAYEEFKKTEGGRQLVEMGGAPMPVGSFLRGKGGYGCYDMAGNVAEVCSDWYKSGYYATSPKENPTGPTEAEADDVMWDGKKTKAIVTRGGDWLNSVSPSRLRCTARGYIPADGLNWHWGFRIICVPEQTGVR
jgi:formylglycine-generating enzyme required for sulfatase activity